MNEKIQEQVDLLPKQDVYSTKFPYSFEVEVTDAAREFVTNLRPRGVDVRTGETPKSYSPTTDWAYLGDTLVKFAPLGTVVVAAAGAWLGRYGRKIRVKVRDIEAEAHTTEEVKKLLALALEIQALAQEEEEKLYARTQEIQARNQPPKVIP